MLATDSQPSAAPPGAPLVAGADAAVRLQHWGLIRAHGSDATSFLHSQLTNDFAALAPGQVRLAGYCSAKGRLQASFFGWQVAEDEWMLACHASVLAATLKRLAMFVLRAKCKLSDAAVGDADLARVCTGLIGQPALGALEAAGLAPSSAWRHARVDGGSVLALPAVDGHPRAVWVAAPAQRWPGAASAASATSATCDLDAWRRLEVRSGIPIIETATVEQFVPQMLNYELIGGVDFQKGCYPGQEVVARSQYRGSVKRRMFLFKVDAACAAGQEVFRVDDATQPAGMVVNAAPPLGEDGASCALVEVKLAALGGTGLRLGTADGPALVRLELPYAVPLDAPANA